MSLYDQFFSDINKDFMFTMANNVLKKDHNIIIEGNENIKNIYLQDMKDIFENNNFEELSDINKLLLDTTIKKNNGIAINENEEEEENNPNPTGYRKLEEDISEKNENKLAELMKERESVTISPPVENNNGTNINDLLKKVSGTKIETIIEDKEEQDEQKEYTETNIQPIEEEVEEEIYERNLKLVSFTSNKRTSINASRYNYSIDLNKEDIDPEKLHSLSKLIIPIEDNYIFTLPILKLFIKELDMEVCLQQKDIIKIHLIKVVFIEPFKILIFNITFPLKKLSIDIRDISNVKYSSNDILKINIMEVSKNIIIFTCSKIDPRNFKINDMIKIINIQTYEMYIIEILSNPLKIKAIRDNMIFCKIDGNHKDNVFNNIDMKILNISNQNMVYFNQYS